MNPVTTGIVRAPRAEQLGEIGADARDWSPANRTVACVN